MKNHICLLLLLITVSFTSSAQGLVSEKGFNETYNVRSEGVIASPNGYFLVRSVSIENNFPTYVFVSYYNNQHALQWDQPLFGNENPLTYEYTKVTSLLPSPDGGMYITSASGGCDYLIDMNTALLKVIPDGAVTVLKAYGSELDEESGGYGGSKKMDCLSILPNGNLEFRCDFAIPPAVSLVEIDPSGNLADSISLTAADLFKGFGRSANWHALGFSENLISGIDTDGSSTPLHAFSTEIAAFAQDDAFLYIATADSVFKIANDSSILLCAPLSPGGSIKQLRIEGDSLVYIQQSGSSIFLVKTGADLNALTSEQFGNDLGGSVYADYNNNCIAIAQNYSLTLFKGIRSLLFKRNDPSGISITRPDVAVSNVKLIDQAVTVYEPSPNSPVLYGANMHLAAVVTNEGEAPIHTLWLNYMKQQGIACNYEYYRNEFTGLNILPGDSLELDLGWITRPVNPTLQTNVCVYSSFVNGLADLNVSNDQFCKLVSHGYVGLDENKADQFSIYPNPSNGEITVRRKSPGMTEYSIYGTNGTLIQSGKSDFTTPLKTILVPGMYFIHLEDQNKTKQVEKIVIN